MRTIPAGKRRWTGVVHAEIVLVVWRIAWVEGHRLGACRPVAREEQRQHPARKGSGRAGPGGADAAKFCVGCLVITPSDARRGLAERDEKSGQGTSETGGTA